MYKYTLQIDGMMCGMCEAHVNDVVRRNTKGKLKKLKSVPWEQSYLTKLPFKLMQTTLQKQLLIQSRKTVWIQLKLMQGQKPL